MWLFEQIRNKSTENIGLELDCNLKKWEETDNFVFGEDRREEAEYWSPKVASIILFVHWQTKVDLHMAIPLCWIEYG